MSKTLKVAKFTGEILGKGKTITLKAIEKIPKIRVQEVYMAGLRTAEGIEVGGFKYYRLAVEAGEKGTGKIVKKSGKPKFRRSMSERRKALLRDAKDPNSGLTKEAREYIKINNGNKVPEGHEVSHEEPLYTRKTIEGKKELDKADNMKTMEKKAHRDRHKECGDQYHDFPR